MAAAAIAPQPTDDDVVLLLLRLGIGKPAVKMAMERARRNGTLPEDELVSSGLVSAPILYEALAELLDLPFAPVIDPARVLSCPKAEKLLSDARHSLRITRINGDIRLVIAPKLRAVVHMLRFLSDNPKARKKFIISTPAAIREAVWQAGSGHRVDEAARSLFERRPFLSARFVMTAWQGCFTGTVLTAAVFVAILQPHATLLALHMALSSLYFALIVLRIAAAAHARVQHVTASPIARLPIMTDTELPVYTVLVALKDEAAVVPQLVKAMNAIDWPRAKLDIKMVCEADDHLTIAALRACALGPQYEIVAVPRRPPFTKPKALSYALNAARGAYVVIYDAEDRPHPAQLREAYAAFRKNGPRLACVQAPLVITNADRSWIAAIFALEYAGLFRGFLPFLAKGRLPLPLGGTSNHFDTGILREAGAWDPYNVTEDADLGLRLSRMGYRLDVITRPTFEDAPTQFNVWLKQRTRWFKGWLQTWLVLMRAPGALLADLRPRRFLAFHLMTIGMLVSALFHPALYVFVVMTLWSLVTTGAGSMNWLTGTLLLADLTNVIGGFFTFYFLGHLALKAKERRKIGWRAAMVPVYWLMMTSAAWRAVYQIVLKPHLWEKTPHRPHVPAHNPEPAPEAEGESAVMPAPSA